MATGKAGDFSAMIPLTCAECGKAFRDYKSKRKHYRVVFCSRPCWIKALNLFMYGYKEFKAFRSANYASNVIPRAKANDRTAPAS